jgi:hypothetical protein
LVSGVLLVAFALVGLFCWYRWISFRISVVVGLVFLVVAAIAVAIGQNDMANFVALLACYSLSVGAGLAILEYLRETKANANLSGAEADRSVVNPGRPPTLRLWLSDLIRLFRRNRK